MIFIRLLPVMFSALLIAAHFLRFYGLVLPAIFLLLLFTFAVRRKWVVRFWQVIMFLGTLVWIDTAANLVRMRSAMGLPWTRLAIIMGAVIIFTAFSGLWLENKHIKAYYGFTPKESRK